MTRRKGTSRIRATVRRKTNGPKVRAKRPVAPARPQRPPAAVKPIPVAGRQRSEDELRRSETELAAIYENTPHIVLLLTRDLRVRKANKFAETFAGDRSANLAGQAPGAALGCLHALDNPEGCGFGPHCQECPLRRTVLDTLETGINHHQVEAGLAVSRQDQAENLTVLVSTTRLELQGEPHVLVTIQDITGRKRAEEGLRASEERYRALIEQAPDGLFVVEWQADRLVFVDVNSAACRMFGYSREEALGLSLADIVPEESLPRVATEIEKLKTGDTGFSKWWLRRKNGSLFPAEVRAREIPGGRIQGFIRDLTELRWAEATVRENEEKFRQLFAAVEDAVFVFDMETRRFVEVNDAGLRLYGYTRDELQPLTAMELTAEPAASEAAIADVMAGRPVRNQPRRHRKKDGTVFPVEISASTFNLQGRPMYCAVVRDITERQQAEAALHEAGQFNQQIVAGAREGIIVYGRDLKYQVWNPFLEEFTGVPASEVIGKHPLEVFPFMAAAGIVEILQRVLAGEECAIKELQFQVPQSGRSGWAADTFSPLRNAQGEITGVIGIVHDITDLKRAEERMARLDRAKAILGAVDSEIVHLADRQKLLDEICRVAVEKGGFKLAWIGMITPEETVQPVAMAGATGYLDGIRVATRDVPEGRGPVGTAIRENRPVVIEDVGRDARMAPWRDQALKFGLQYVAAFPIRIAGQVAGAFQVYAPQANFFDVSELDLLTQVCHDVSLALTAMANLAAREQAEAALRQSEARFKLIFDSVPVGIAFQTAHPDGSFTRSINDAHLRICGITRDQHKPETYLKITHPDDRPVQNAWDKQIRAGRIKQYSMEKRYLHKDGKIVWVDFFLQRETYPDGTIDQLTTVVDITARKEAEAALRQSEARFKLIFDSVPIGIAFHTVHPDGTFTRSINDAHLRICGLTRDQHDEPETYLNITHPDDRPVQHQFSEQVRAGRIKQFSMEKRYLHQDGKIVWVTFSYQREIHPDGSIEELTTVVDITARKQAEDLLRLSEHHLSMFFNQAPIGLGWLGADGTILRANQAQMDLVGYSAAEYLGHSFLEFCGEPAQGQELLRLLAARETVRNFPMIRRCKDGTIRHVLVDANSFWSGEKFQYYSVFLRDITDRVRLEQEILQVGEREHRRIAQDLHDGLGQLLVGTAYLTSTLQKDLAAKSLPEARQLGRILEVINESIALTRSLARGLHPVAPEPNGLMVALEELAARTKKLFRIRCHFTCHQPVLIKDNAVATHLFRIAQEAITNAIKHGQPGRIEVSLTELPGRIMLAVKDDGSGMPDGPHKHPGLGLRIMRYRAGVINGSVGIQKEAGGGTVVVCTVQTADAAGLEIVPPAKQQRTKPSKEKD